MMPPTPRPEADCCAEFRRAEGVARRSLLKSAGALGAGLALTQTFGEAVLNASFAGGSSDNVLVVLSMRGGIDGLGVVVPHGDPAYAKARPNIGLKPTALIGADAMFGLHPKLAPLKGLWDNGRLAAVHAVGMAVPNRSHFAAVEQIEDAMPGSSARSGWVNRMIGLGDEHQSTEAVHLGSSIAPAMLTGPEPVLVANNTARLQVGGLGGDFTSRRYASLATTWAGSSSPLSRGAREASTLSAGPGARLAAAGTSAAYPTTSYGADLSRALKGAADLIRLDVGTNVVSVDHGNWDLHSNYGVPTSGSMSWLLEGFAQALAGFMADLGALADKVTVVTISEFGRRVTENGNRGLDHGWGNMMLVAGAGVKGGKYYGRWPGLGTDKLTDGDLQVTTDYRNVLGEVVRSRFPDRSLASVFPGLSYKPLGLMA